MTSNIPNYVAVKDLINCGVHEGRTGEVEGGGGGSSEKGEREKKKTPEPKVKKKERKIRE